MRIRANALGVVDSVASPVHWCAIAQIANLKPVQDDRKCNSCTPRKINMEHNHGGLEDHFPF